MDYCISSAIFSSSSSSTLFHSSSKKKTQIPSFLSSRVSYFRGNFSRLRTTSDDRCGNNNLRKTRGVFAAAANAASSAPGGSQCGEHYSCLNTPLEPSSAAGKLLAGVLLDNRDSFPVLVKEQLEQLKVDRSHAVARINLNVDSDEAYLYRRVAEIKEQECQTVVHDLMYLLICYKFYGIGVHLVPRLSKCIYNDRLEISPSLDWELESIHTLEVLEMIKEHLTVCVGWKANSTVASKWDRLQVSRFQLCRVYTASILFGYFLKSTSFRHSLEQSLYQINVDLALPNLFSSGSMSAFFNSAMITRRHKELSSVSKEQDLKYYLMGFDSQTMQMCSKPKSKVAINLIESHCTALFGNESAGSMETNEAICTSFATMKRFALEAIAFGSFLWETEQYIGNVYELEEN